MLYECDNCGAYLGVGVHCVSCEQARRGGPEFESKLFLLEQERAKRLAWLDGLGRRAIIGLVGCGKAKRDGIWPARDLYVGSLFHMSLRYAEATCDETYILSAQHRLINLDTQIESYDYSLYDLRLGDRYEWGLGVTNRLNTKFPDDMPLTFRILAGNGYIQPLRQAFETFPDRPWFLETPLMGLSLFGRLAWFRDALRRWPCEEGTGCAC